MVSVHYVKLLFYGVKLMFPASRVKQFKAEIKSKGLNDLRYGQAFHNYMCLDKCTQDKDFLDALYYADQPTAVAMITAFTDPTC